MAHLNYPQLPVELSRFPQQQVKYLGALVLIPSQLADLLSFLVDDGHFGNDSAAVRVLLWQKCLVVHVCRFPLEHW
jgi:hypothetical protein